MDFLSSPLSDVSPSTTLSSPSMESQFECLNPAICVEDVKIIVSEKSMQVPSSSFNLAF